MQQRQWLRARLAERRTVWGAGCYDALSAKLIEAAGFEAVLTSGFGISASFLGKPDVELYTMTENLAVTRQVVSTVKIPVIADCDTGYGNAVNVMRTVREFEQAGVAAVILEDQVVPKRCPAIANRIELIPTGEGVAKIKAAVEARRDPDLVIIALATVISAVSGKNAMPAIASRSCGERSFSSQPSTCSDTGTPAAWPKRRSMAPSFIVLEIGCTMSAPAAT